MKDGLLEGLALLVSRRAVSLALVAVIVVVDIAIPLHGVAFVPRALIDEPGHLATALVVLGAITRFRRGPPSPAFGWAMLAWSVLIDVDHLPLEFGSPVLTAGTPRPYFHALWFAAALSAAAVVACRSPWRARTPAAAPIIVGAACGVTAHFLRDVATASMSLWWPLTDAAVQVPYWSYVLVLLVIVAVPARSQP